MLRFKSKAFLIKRINELESLTNRWAQAWGESVEREGKLIEEKQTLLKENIKLRRKLSELEES